MITLNCNVCVVIHKLKFTTKRKRPPRVFNFNGAEGGSRTHMNLSPHDPESCASASSATSAGIVHF